MFEALPAAPVDPIFGLMEAYQADSRPDRINLTVGIYKDEHGKTPVLDCVRHAQAMLHESETSKSYAPIPGDPGFGREARALLFRPEHPLVDDGRAFTAHCAGGTGALRIAGEYLRVMHPGARLWLSRPTWANHRGVFGEVGLELPTYAWLDEAGTGLDMAGLTADLADVRAGDVVLLHGCCHNPTGVDPTLEQWRTIGQLLVDAGAVPLVDFAYQGFGAGLNEDAAGLRALVEQVPEILICSSYSKNFGMYNERVGALTIVTPSPEAAAKVAGHVKLRIRRTWSNPPARGAATVSTILQDTELRALWQVELSTMRQRINGMRADFVAGLKAHGIDGYDFIERQHGMFGLTGWTPEQVDRLRVEHGVYALRSGRVNFAGMTAQNLPRLCAAVAEVRSS